jgi:mRNA interferase RelE/StbE
VARFRILIKQSAAKKLEALPNKKARQRVVARIRALGDEPRPAGCEELSGHHDRYRIRQGVFRVVYSNSDKELLVYVVKVGHRKDVYR